MFTFIPNSVQKAYVKSYGKNSIHTEWIAKELGVDKENIKYNEDGTITVPSNVNYKALKNLSNLSAKNGGIWVN